jgi:hypothetical protein
VIAALPLCLALLLAPGLSEAGPTFTVTSTLDAAGGGNLADGVCETATGNHVCTLRAAVMEANHVVGGGATVLVPTGTYFLSLPPARQDSETSGDLNVTAPMTIAGDGPSATVLDGNLIARVIDVAASPVVLRGLTLQTGGTFFLLPDGGCLRNTGELTLENAVVTDCRGETGGGFFNGGTATIRHSTLANSFTGTLKSGGGAYNAVGATLRIEDSLVTSNHASSGGGVANLGDATIERTSILSNEAGASGLAGFGGGTVFNTGTLAIVNSTLSGNSASQFGGGLYQSNGSAQLLHVTITENFSNTHDFSVGATGGGIAVLLSNSVFLRNSIVAGNQTGMTPAPNECLGTIVSADYDVIGARSTCSLTGNLAHVNASDAGSILFPLHANGGFARDRFASVGSVPPASCTDLIGAPLRIDGRGFARSACTIGATESAPSFYAPETLIGVELLRNGGAAGSELGQAASDESYVEPPYWVQETDSLGQVAYGTNGFPLRTDAPPASGSYFFAGGLEPSSAAEQLVDVSAVASEVDAGTLEYRISGAFGGFATDDDNASLTVHFLDADSATLLSASIGGFTAADRGNVTKLLPDSDDGLVPIGTRILDIVLTATISAGAYNDGYADDLSVMLPEPSVSLAAFSALAALGIAARRSNTRRQATARRSASRSSFFIWSIACIARLAFCGSGWFRNSGSCFGTICHERP